MSKLELHGQTVVLKLKSGGLSLIDPKASTKSLLVKWVIKAFCGGKSNHHLLIKFILKNARPNMKTIGAMGLDGCFETTTYWHMDEAYER